jgi:hypothetical protein
MSNYKNVDVSIDKRRWNTYITITEQDGTRHELVASADSNVTYSDGIFFDTKDEYERRSNE